MNDKRMIPPIRTVCTGSTMPYRATWRGPSFELVDSLYVDAPDVGRESHDVAFLTFVLAGGMRVGLGAEDVHVSLRQASFLPPGIDHTTRYEYRGTRLLFFKFPISLLAKSGVRKSFPDHQVVLAEPILRLILASILQELSIGDSAALVTIEERLHDALNLATRSTRLQAKNQSSPRWLIDTIEYLKASFASDLGLDTLAGRADIHPVHFARVFRAHVGCSVGQYIRSLRMELAARQMLETDRSLAQIAGDAGFFDQAHFTRLFKQRLGTSPGRLRRMVLEAESPSAFAMRLLWTQPG